MTLSTSARRDIRTALIYLIISIALAAAGAVYEHFSFGVYSNWMIYAFAVPLVMGTLVFTLRGLRKMDGRECSENAPDTLWHLAAATLTVGSVMHGALEICGRPNMLVIGYPLAAAVLIGAYLYRRSGKTISGSPEDRDGNYTYKDAGSYTAE